MRRPVTLIMTLLFPAAAQAGMPSFTLTDIASFRLEAISFFLFLLLLCAWGVRALWNGMRRDFPALPGISYRTALAVTLLVGVLFNLLLLMISGARELMTPEAWEKQGYTYTLKKSPQGPGQP